MSILKRLFARYVVVAQFDGKTKQHYARDWDEALDWARYYSHAYSCAIYERCLGITALSPSAVRWGV
ncbi:hypothetical protein [Achromobacter aloeverae]|uniref:Uncharacterized protein n=1 Tax=Achromobacter aloeverae TaxID=1750518 RepID=A0A4Q1HJU8_9BURK|nr:hypothetical protein [Achromobacter aloeverae]RXN87993.1 hypothetical protein C7R54_15565 [Achromobacter aloeverae]